jgi:hypothetical protein
MNWSDSPLKEAIRRLPIPVLWHLLNLPGKVTEHCSVRSPFRDDDRQASFSIYATLVICRINNYT